MVGGEGGGSGGKAGKSMGIANGHGQMFSFSILDEYGIFLSFVDRSILPWFDDDGGGAEKMGMSMIYLMVIDNRSVKGSGGTKWKVYRRIVN